MNKIGGVIKRILYKVLSLEGYLLMLSKFYFLSFNLGILRKNRTYDYPYLLGDLIKEGQTCVDIGANLGYLSVLFAKIVGKNGKVYSVEPVTPVRNVLLKNTKRFSQVEVLPIALGDENKPIKLGNDSIHKKGFMASGSHFVIDNENGVDVEFNAEMKRGSEVFADLERLDFLKCDIEGYEIIVIPEMETVIDKFLPMVLLEAEGDNRKRLLKFFNDKSYYSFVVENGKLREALVDETWDILFVHESKKAIIDHLIR